MAREKQLEKKQNVNTNTICQQTREYLGKKTAPKNLEDSEDIKEWRKNQQIEEEKQVKNTIERFENSEDSRR